MCFQGLSEGGNCFLLDSSMADFACYWCSVMSCENTSNNKIRTSLKRKCNNVRYEKCRYVEVNKISTGQWREKKRKKKK